MPKDNTLTASGSATPNSSKVDRCVDQSTGMFEDRVTVPDHVREIMRENSRQLENVTRKVPD